MDSNKFKAQKRLRRRYHGRKKCFGDPQRPRLNVYRSLRHMYAQIIDDESGNTLVAASTGDKSLEAECKNGGNRTAAAAVGKLLARKALEVGIHQVKFDRNGFKFHGRVKAMADAAREGGLVF